MNLQQYIAAGRLLDPQDWSIAECMENLVKTLFAAAGLDLYFPEEFHSALPKCDCYEIYDLPHQSDESCAAYILVCDSVPVSLHRRLGDRMEYSDGVRVLDRAAAAKIMRAAAAALIDRMDQKLEKEVISPESFEDALWAENQYLTPVADGVVSVDSPRWACAFARFTAERQCRVVVNGQLAAVRFDGFVNNKQSWQGEDANDAWVKNEGGERFVVDSRDILINLGGQPDWDAALKVINKPDHYFGWRQNDPKTLVHVRQFRQGRLRPVRYLGFSFASAEDADAFIDFCGNGVEGNVTVDQVRQRFTVTDFVE